MRILSEYDAWPEDEPRDPPPPMLGRLIVDIVDPEGVRAFAGSSRGTS